MQEPGKHAGLSGSFDWSATCLGDASQWPPTLRLAVDVVLNTPLPMLLVWGAQRVAVFNPHYAALAGSRHARAPGGAIPVIWPAPLEANPDAFDRALSGEVLHLAYQELRLPGARGTEAHACDLHLTPVRDGAGAVGGVLYTIAPCSPGKVAANNAALRILVVEDNLDSQYLVCEMLKAFGHEADGIGHGEGALEMLRHARYDVLFSDVSLPGISGVEMARQALRIQRQLKVIFASGYGDALLRHVEFPYQSLQKPYELEQLQSALANISQQLQPGGDREKKP